MSVLELPRHSAPRLIAAPAAGRAAPLGLFPDRPGPRLHTAVVHELRTRHYSLETEKAYVHWIGRFVRFHGRRHPLLWPSRR